MILRALAFVFVPFLFACGGESFVEQPTQVSFDPAGKSFWSLPLPSEHRRNGDGLIDYTDYPTPQSAIADAWLATATAQSKDGYGVTNGVFFPISGAIDPSSLPSTAKDTLDKNSRGVDQSVAAREATSTWQGSRATRLFMQVRLTEIRPIDSYGERGAVANPRMAAFVQRRS